MQTDFKYELHNVLSGKSEVRNGATIQTIANYLRRSEKSSPIFEDEKLRRKQEAEILINYVSEHNLWVNSIDFSQYVSEGAEQRVYLKDDEFVLKLNDSIYYNSWKDYLYNLLLHNFFFSDTAYELLGFTIDNQILYAVVKQSFVTVTSETDLSEVKTFLIANGFENIRNNDYLNKNIGIILEDLHDENVLTQNNILYFIDTVFYLTDKFWEK